MELDQRLAQEVCMGIAPPTLRIYQWLKPAVSVGRRQDVFALPRDLLSLPVVRRPTGGGAVVHQIEELTYAWALPRTLAQGYRPLADLPGRLHQHLRPLLVDQANFHLDATRIAEADSPGPHTFCFSAPMRGDLLYQGRKVGGTALRAWRSGILIQGSIQGFPVEFDLLAKLLTQAAMDCVA